MRKPFLIMIAAVVAILSLITGCVGWIETPSATGKAETETTETEEMIVLTERQQKILADEGLPTDYSSLSLTQKAAINAIEDIFCYLESHYDDRFSYVGYVAPSAIEEEHLIAVSEKYPHLGTVIVYRNYSNGSYVYRDNYTTLIAKPLYEQAIDTWLSQSIDQRQFIVFSEISSADLEVQEELVLSQASAATYVLISEDGYSAEMLASLVTNFGEWIKEQSGGRQASTTIFYVVSSDVLLAVNTSNYQEIIAARQYIATYSCLLSKQGNLNIFRGGE